jgi:hypothetical protein
LCSIYAWTLEGKFELCSYRNELDRKVTIITRKMLHNDIMRSSSSDDIEDILPAEKVAFIAYNIGIFESVQKFGNLITSGKITSGMDPAKVAEFLADTFAFYDAEMIAQLINGMLAQRANMKLPSLTVGRVTARQVGYVIRQLNAAGISLNK